jgi:integrase
VGSVRRLPATGRLFVDFRFGGQRCREYTALEDTASNRRRLETVLARIDKAIKAGTFRYGDYFPDSPRARPAVRAQAHVPEATAAATAVPERPEACAPTFREFASLWTAERRIEWRRSHAKIVEATIEKHLLPRFGELRVNAISKADILGFRADLAGKAGRTKSSKLSARRINGVLTPLRQILEEATERFGFSSPFKSIRPLKQRKSDIKPFTLEEVARLFAAVRADYRPYLTVRFFTGLRTGEVHGLKWKYVDFERRLIYVRETLVDGEEDYTKTDSSQRDIQMSSVVLDALQAQRASRTEGCDYVFANRRGNPIENHNFCDRVWYPLLRHLQLERRRPYQMRHTAATLWLAAGENPEWIAKQLGHATTEMLFRVYSRFVPNLTRNDGSAFERLLSRLPGQTDDQEGARDDART